jgi:hypothetical protein
MISTPGTCEQVVIRNNWGHRTDMGCWRVDDADGNRLPRRGGAGRRR